MPGIAIDCNNLMTLGKGDVILDGGGEPWEVVTAPHRHVGSINPVTQKGSFAKMSLRSEGYSAAEYFVVEEADGSISFHDWEEQALQLDLSDPRARIRRAV
jgi:hypothetical protein